MNVPLVRTITYLNIYFVIQSFSNVVLSQVNPGDSSLATASESKDGHLVFNAYK